MKNLFVIITVIFASLLTSCSKEEVMNSTGESNRVCIFAELPEDAAATRAQIGIAATHKLRCIIEVWTKEDLPVLVHREEVAIEAGAIPPFEFALKAGDYNCLMWADFIKKEAGTTLVTSEGVTYDHFEEIYYRTADLHAVTILDEDAVNLFDTDLCDAFFAQLELKKEEGGVSEQLKLARPFAKLIVKEKDVEKFGELKKMRTIYEVPKGFNVAMGEPISETMNAVYEKTFEEDDQSQVLFTNYIFAPAATSGKALGAMALSFTTNGKMDCEIAAGSIIIKRNEKASASGNLITEGTIDPDPEPEEGTPKVGDYFFKDGTWNSELTDANKANCVGIVYAVGTQAGDNIGNYGESGADKQILGYVMALESIYGSAEDGLIADESMLNGRIYWYNVKAGLYETLINTFPYVAPLDVENSNGYANTEGYLSSSAFTDHRTDFYFPALQIFTKWQGQQSAIANASKWYIPSFKQLSIAVGGCYGYAGVSSFYDFPAVEKVEALASAFETAKRQSIAKGFTTGKHFMLTSTISLKQPGYEPIVILCDNTSAGIKPQQVNKPAGVIRPVFTILK